VVCSDGTLLNIGNEDGFLHKAWTQCGIPFNAMLLSNSERMR
jgi:hypothetical protein